MFNHQLTSLYLLNTHLLFRENHRSCHSMRHFPHFAHTVGLLFEILRHELIIKSHSIRLNKQGIALPTMETL